MANEHAMLTVSPYTRYIHPRPSKYYASSILPSSRTSNEMAHQVNGDTSSAFLSHLTSYPLIHDSISTFKSLSIWPTIHRLNHHFHTRSSANHSFHTSKSLTNTSLHTSRKSTNSANLLYRPLIPNSPPLRNPLGNEGKEYALGKYNSEVKKTEDQGIVGFGKAVVSTGLIVSSEAFQWLSQFLSAKKAEAKETTHEKTNN
ncbi:hypothetical protein DID88_002896 [Monilinia fructigena]|uniref:Uncharacterized protein n=1 Tax=Monilinia fructigena TaxID=38457 RepID=A0A395IR02_9HELO|nr:hypothetical protein DID88_002896 [Monilinia fructigena]